MKQFSRIIIVLLFAIICLCDSTFIYGSDTRVQITFFRYNVVPNIIEQFPKTALPIYNKLSRSEIDSGSKLRSSFFETKPCLNMDIDMTGSNYSTLIVYDADVCCQGRNLLWMWKNNILGQATDEQTSYYPPIGCKSQHRIIYLVYQHNHPLDFDLINLDLNGQNSTNFNLTSFTRDYNLGAPVQGNLLLANLSDDDDFLTMYLMILAFILTLVALYYVLKCFFSKYIK